MPLGEDTWMSAAHLSTWKSGDEGTVTGLEGSSPLAGRLQELGVIPGARIRVVQHGSPMLIQVGDSRLCLRREDASGIHAQAAAAKLSVAACGLQPAK